MLPSTVRSRRRPRYTAQICAFISAILLLLSVSLLHTRLSSSHTHTRSHTHTLQNDDVTTTIYSESTNPLLSDSNDDVLSSEDKIDVQDIIDDTNDDDPNSITELEDLIKGDDEIERPAKKSNGFYFDYLTGSIRRRLNRRSIENWGDDDVDDVDGNGDVGFGFEFGLSGSSGSSGDSSMRAFASDDIPVSEFVRGKVNEVRDVEDALLLKLGRKVSPLRDGWGDWFDKKGEFLRRDRMFKSNLEVLNPMNNPMLQDPDGVGVTGLSRGDKMIQKLLLSEFKRVPFLAKKPLGVSEARHGELRSEGDGSVVEGKGGERRTLDETVIDGGVKKVSDGSESLRMGGKKSSVDKSGNSEESMVKKNVEGDGDLGQYKNEFSGNIYADGNRWGYYPNLEPHLSFSDFMDAFFREGNCSMRVFMVWNSPSWMYSVRHQRGLESLLSHHRDACVVVFSETIELDFFKDSFLKDGYKIAVAMPNLDELLEDTPTHIFASAWHEWKKTKYYSTHYSELVRLASLYKYGGIYLDCDIVVLQPLSLLDNTVGLEDQLAGSPLNGAVMAFKKQSTFIKECLKEFYMTYDDTKLRWNGADLITRVASHFRSKNLELKVQPSSVFFPISSQNITRYFAAPATEAEKAQHDALFQKILDQSLTFHYWNSLTSSLIPEPESLVTRILDRHCIRCSDIL